MVGAGVAGDPSADAAGAGRGVEVGAGARGAPVDDAGTALEDGDARSRRGHRAPEAAGDMTRGGADEVVSRQVGE